jgi:hypothetical protein
LPSSRNNPIGRFPQRGGILSRILSKFQSIEAAAQAGVGAMLLRCCKSVTTASEIFAAHDFTGHDFPKHAGTLTRQ